MTEKQYPVYEAFRSIQGEGSKAGNQTVFVRLQFCDGDRTTHCSWCDTRFTWDPQDPAFRRYTYLTAPQILQKVTDLLHATKPVNTNIVFTGGNPMIWMDESLLETFYGFDTFIETQGTIWKPCIKMCKGVVVSPKPPSSGMKDLDKDILEKWALSENVTFKVVIFDETDFNWATNLYNTIRGIAAKNDVVPSPFFLQAGTSVSGDAVDAAIDKYSWLVEHWLKSGDMPFAIALPQMHVLVWGRKTGV